MLSHNKKTLVQKKQLFTCVFYTRTLILPMKAGQQTLVTLNQQSLQVKTLE